MNRLLVASGDLEMDSPVLSRENLNHLKVLRPETDEEFELFDGAGRYRKYVYDGSRLQAAGDVAIAPAPRPLILFACITKGSRWDWTLEKATELGATEIVPVVSDRTIVRIPKTERAVKRERWERIAKDAARQCDTKFVPLVHEAVDFPVSLEKVCATACMVGALTEKTRMIGQVAAELARGERPLAVYVGPEGDFSPRELEQLYDLAVPVSFGANVLRAETAAIFALSVIKGVADVQAG